MERVEKREGRVLVSGGELWYRLTNPTAEGPPLVVVHGGPGCPAYYLEPLEALADERPVLIYDQLGCGRSTLDPAPEHLTLDGYVADLHSLLTALGIERAVLLGQSFGGMLTLAYLRDHPETAAAVVLASPLVSTDAWMEDADVLMDALPEPARTDIRRPVDDPRYQAAEAVYYAEHFCRLDPWPELLQRTMAELALPVYTAMWGPNEFTQTGNLAGVDCADVLDTLGLPILFTARSEDEARPETLHDFAARCQDGHLVVLADGSHCVHLEQPDTFAAVVRDFLNSIT